MTDIRKDAMWRAIAYVYAGPLVLLAGAWHYHAIETWALVLIAPTLFFLLLPALGEVGIASVYQAEKKADRLARGVRV